jgi:hypothetical protein
LTQAWLQVPAPLPAPAGAFRLVLARNTSQCLLRPHCGSDSVVAVGDCSSAAAGCEGGLGAAWRSSTSNSSSAPAGQLVSLVAGGGCLTMEPRISAQKCAAAADPAPYQQLTYIPATGQLAMNFTGSGALGDYTGYAQCLDVLQTDSAEVWAGGLADGGWSVLLLNPSAAPGSVRVNVSAVAEAVAVVGAGGNSKGLPRALKAVRDVGSRKNLSNASLVFDVPVNATGAVFLRITPA